MEQQKITWKDIVKAALVELGGQGHLNEINRIVETNPRTSINPTWQDTIRRVVRQYKIFEPVPPDRSGVYKLVEEPATEAGSQTFQEKAATNHGIAQGMLVALGRTYGYETYVPPTDQTKRLFQNRPLRDYVSVADCSETFKGPNLRKIREVDTIWFDEDDYGLFPVYAFEVEETTKENRGWTAF